MHLVWASLHCYWVILRHGFVLCKVDRCLSILNFYIYNNVALCMLLDKKKHNLMTRMRWVVMRRVSDTIHAPRILWWTRGDTEQGRSRRRSSGYLRVTQVRRHEPLERVAEPQRRLPLDSSRDACHIRRKPYVNTNSDHVCKHHAAARRREM